jgi:hypothetical protein
MGAPQSGGCCGAFIWLGWLHHCVLYQRPESSLCMPLPKVRRLNCCTENWKARHFIEQRQQCRRRVHGQEEASVAFKSTFLFKTFVCSSDPRLLAWRFRPVDNSRVQDKVRHAQQVMQSGSSFLPVCDIYHSQRSPCPPSGGKPSFTFQPAGLDWGATSEFCSFLEVSRNLICTLIQV